MNPARLAATFVVSAALLTAQRPPAPFEDAGACPFEGCQYTDWTANAPVPLRATRRVGAPITYRIRKGEKVTALTGVVVTTQPGEVVFPKGGVVKSMDGDLHIGPGETLYLLTYQGEGETHAWFNGRLYHNADAWEFLESRCIEKPGSCIGTVRKEWQSVWWVQMKTSTGITGWTSETEKFDGKDRFGDR